MELISGGCLILRSSYFTCVVRLVQYTVNALNLCTAVPPFVENRGLRVDAPAHAPWAAFPQHPDQLVSFTVLV